MDSDFSNVELVTVRSVLLASTWRAIGSLGDEEALEPLESELSVSLAVRARVCHLSSSGLVPA